MLQRICTEGLLLSAVQGPRCRGRNVVRAAMFDDLSRNLEKAWDMVRKDGKLTKDNIKEPMREIRRALLEADVRLCNTLQSAALNRQSIQDSL